MSIAEFRALGSSGKRNKYHAEAAFRCENCGAAAPDAAACLVCGGPVRRFDSKAEASRWDELRFSMRLGCITDLRCQVRFPIVIQGTEIGAYVADFTYRDEVGGLVVEDVKGGKATDTPLSRFKRKAVEAAHGIRVVIVQ